MYTSLKKLSQSLFFVAFFAISVLLMLELTYRCYWVDFYYSNLEGLNSSEELAKEKAPTILVIGDSFSADQNSYVQGLKNNLPKYRIINSAIPGTCARQHSLMLKKRVQQFDPDFFIYQIYIGNDLLEWRHPCNSPKISLLRKYYWWLADKFYVLGYINAKLPHLRQALLNDLPTEIDPKVLQNFAPEKYSSRSKMLFRAEPNLIENSVLLKRRRKEDLEELTKSIQKMIAELPVKCKVVLLPIPHCMQLGAPYLNRLQMVGATVSQPDKLTIDDYPFIAYLKTQLSSNRVQVLNPLPLLREKDVEQPVYYNNDPHLNPYGQAVLSNYLVDIFNKIYISND